MKTPMFSFIIPTLNEQKYLPTLLTSIAEQYDQDFEVILSDGGSEDATIQKARTYEKKFPLTIMVHTEKGVAHQRNEGAKKARGEWLVFVDADSVLFPYTLSRCRVFIKERQPDIFSSWFSADSYIPSEVTFTLLSNIFIEGSFVAKRPCVTGAFSVVNASVFATHGGYNEKTTFGEDYDLSQQLYTKGYVVSLLPETLFVYSLRRMRRYGKFRFIQTYAIASLYSFLTKKSTWWLPGYMMGGHVYQTMPKRPLSTKALRRLEERLKQVISKIKDAL